MGYKYKRLSGKFRRHDRGKLIVYKPGDICEFDSPRDIGKVSQHKWKAIDKVPTEEEITGEEIPELGLIVTSAGPGWYDVINEKTGKTINDKKMRKKQAETLATSLGSPPKEVEKKKIDNSSEEEKTDSEENDIVMHMGADSEDITEVIVRDKNPKLRRDRRGEED